MDGDYPKLALVRTEQIGYSVLFDRNIVVSVFKQYVAHARIYSRYLLDSDGISLISFRQKKAL